MVAVLKSNCYNERNLKRCEILCISERMEDMMDKHQILKECMENLALLSQLGLSIVIPPLLCLYAANWLRNRLDLGLWMMAVALILGLGGSVVNFWRFWKMIEKRGNKPHK